MNFNKIGHESLKAFVKTTQNVISHNNQFNFIVAAGDSGHIAAHITREVYSALEMSAPPTFIAPIYRHVDKERTVLFDNTILAEQSTAWRNKDMGRVLFIDDEIWAGNSLKATLGLLAALNAIPQHCTVVAEDGGFDCPLAIQGIPLAFVPTKQRVSDIYNAISYTVPSKFKNPVSKSLKVETPLNNKQIMCALLNLPTKDWNNGEPWFTLRLSDRARQKLPHFDKLQAMYRKCLQDAIRSYLSQ